MYLRQSTASQEIALGPFVDSTDGNTEESGLTIANTDIKLHKAGATTLASKASGGATYISNGVYYAVLDATDTDTLGNLAIFVHVSGALAVRVQFVVLPANIYDSMILGTDLFDVSVTQLGGVAQSLTDLKDFADDGYDPSTNKVQGVVLTDTVTTYTGNTPQTGDAFARVGAAGAGLTALGDTRLANLDAAVSTRMATYTQPTGFLVASFPTDPADQSLVIAATDAVMARLGTPAGASVSADVAAVKAQTAAIETDTAEIGVAGAGLTVLATATALATVDDFLDTEIAAIKAKTDNLPAAPAAVSDIPTASAIADQVWDEAIAGHVGAGSTGLALSNATAPTAAAVADAVWDEALSGHLGAGSTGNALNAAGSAGDPWATAIPGAYGAGTAGKILGDNINATISSRASQTSVDIVDDFLDTEIAAIKAKTDNLPSDPADQSAVEAAITAATSPLATAVALTVVDDFLDTEIAAIKAVTDTFTFTGTDVKATLDGETVALTAGQIQLKKNVARANFPFVMRDSTTNEPATGLTVTATRSLDGAAFGACANAVVEVASGLYKISLAAGDVNADVVVFKFTAATAKTCIISVVTQP